MTGWSRNNQYEYPNDFEGILNEVEIYVCPMSGNRIIKANGIPDHTVTQGNPNYPCEVNWIVSVSPSEMAIHSQHHFLRPCNCCYFVTSRCR